MLNVEEAVLRDGGVSRAAGATVLRTRGATGTIALDTDPATMTGENASARNAANGGAGITMRIVALLALSGYRLPDPHNQRLH